MDAVEPQHVVPVAEPGGALVAVGGRGRGPGDHAGEQRRLHAERPGRVLEFLDGFVGRRGRDHGHRGQPVRIVGEVLRREGVEGAQGLALQVLVLGDGRRAGRVHDAEVEAEFVEALVEEPGHHRRRAVAGVGHGHLPEPRVGGPVVAPTFRAHTLRLADEGVETVETLGYPGPGDLGDALLHHRPELEPVGVRIDDGVLEPCVDLLRVHRASSRFEIPDVTTLRGAPRRRAAPALTPSPSDGVAAARASRGGPGCRRSCARSAWSS